MNVPRKSALLARQTELNYQLQGDAWAHAVHASKRELGEILASREGRANQFVASEASDNTSRDP